MIMRRNLLASFRRHADEAYPKECCALLVKVGRQEIYFKCVNVADNPADEFVIRAACYAEAETLGEIVGVCHSHPDATSKPSDRDVAMCNSGAVPWHILSWPENDLRTIVPETAPLIGRPFVHGTDFDCYGLIRAWYQQERGVELPRYLHDRHWWELGEDLYLDHYQEADFKPLFIGEPTAEAMNQLQPGDVILMQVQSPVINHGAVYMGGNQILHHLFGQRSKTDVYGPGGYWAERTRLVVRYAEH